MISYYFELDWVLLIVASRNSEVNAVKYFFELNWEPFLSQLTWVLNQTQRKWLQKNAKIITRLDK